MTAPNYFQAKAANAKKWALIKERAAAKRLREGVPEKKKAKPKPKKTRRHAAVLAGDVYDKLTVIEQRPPDDRGNAMALFRCSGGSVDCAKEVVTRVSTAKYNLKSGWCSCAPCYRAEGGIAVWKEEREPLKVKKVPRPWVSDGVPANHELVKRVVAFIAGRDRTVKITTLLELRAAFKENRLQLIKALLQAQADGSIERRRTCWATGYVLCIKRDKSFLTT